ncbi:pectate lyase superfamily protein [Halalkalicoccus paucihalophilus]|uniref:Pectate lyase superfamily protein n=1 Tax=Halalkalicoccus paucihalophilus TaxID=1008153 RepID=A0A151AAT8_9EURY|nr:glycoside hydrolase family 55 protein [Halalkalicoccus paucihalophilus]KYH24808.1 pectate lyase superfamily protein [Halalkalicoccus paucihalophilus]
MPERRRSHASRRTYLGTIAGVALTPVLAATASADEEVDCPRKSVEDEESDEVDKTEGESGAEGDENTEESESSPDYSTVVDIVEAGADNSGNTSITSVLNDVADDDTLIQFPEGTYLVDGTLRITDYSKFGMTGSEATIDVAPTDSYVFKLGTYQSPIDDLHVEGLTFDISGSNTGGRALELQANDRLEARNIAFVGQHDTPSKGPMLVGLHTNVGSGIVENIDLSDGGVDASGGNGGTGLLVSTYHQGTVTIRNAQIGPFPDNGLYVSGSGGQVNVEGGTFKNANVAGVRLEGDGSTIDGAQFIVDESIDGFGSQRPIRLDEGSNLEVRNVDIEMDASVTEAIRVLPDVESATISNVSMDLSNQVRDGIAVTEGAGSVDVDGLNIDGNPRYEVFEY